MRNKNADIILFALVGLSPAVLTETIWALAERDRNMIPDRIFVITTSEGREKLITTLFEEDRWARFKQDIAQHFEVKIGKKLRFGPIPEALSTIPNQAMSEVLSDIRTQTENLAAAEHILENLRRFTEINDNQIIASIAGGRKTMGALLHSIMTMMGREQDWITHVLVPNPWDRLPGFLYPGCPGTFLHPETQQELDSSMVRVELAEIPFVPLRNVFNKEVAYKNSYKQLVNDLKLQSSLAFTEQLFLNVSVQSRIISVDGARIQLNPTQFAFYLYFVERVLDGKEPLAAFKDINKAEMLAILAPISENTDINHWTSQARDALTDAVPTETWKRLASEIRNKFRRSKLASIYSKKLVPHRYCIGIDLPAENISLEKNI